MAQEPNSQPDNSSKPPPPPLSPPMRAARNQALSEWRGQQQEGLEPAWHCPAKAASEILQGVLNRLRLEERFAESQLIHVWNKALDATITSQAQPVGLRKGTLFVRVSNHVLLSELVRYRREEILERLQLSCGREVVQRISFRIG